MDVAVYLGNLAADAAAGAAAKAFVLGIEQEEREKYSAYIFKIALRLAYIEAEAWDHIPSEVQMYREDPHAVRQLVREECKQHIKTQLQARKHRLRIEGDFRYCEKCRKKRKIGNDALWTDTPCVNGEKEEMISLGCDASDGDAGRLHAKRSCADRVMA